jgi:hypothetical protein
VDGHAQQPGAEGEVHAPDHRQNNRLDGQQAHGACAAALLRWLHVIVVRRVAWDPTIAAGTTDPAPIGQAA